MEGAGVRLVRSIATSELDHVDPAGQCCGPFWASLPAALHQGWIDRTRAEFRGKNGKICALWIIYRRISS